MTIEYVERVPDADRYLDLFETTGWNAIYRVTMHDLQQVLHTPWYCVSAYEGETLVGFGRVLSDGVLYAVIFDMIVRPEHQRRGIGSTVLRMILDRCERSAIRDVLLFSARGTVDFYARFGFQPRPDGAPGMIRRRGS